MLMTSLSFDSPPQYVFMIAPTGLPVDMFRADPSISSGQAMSERTAKTPFDALRLLGIFDSLPAHLTSRNLAH
jgi:hypothetical protein